MIPTCQFRPATPTDDSALRALLAVSGLPSSDVSAAQQDYLVAVSGDSIIGCVGLELYGDDVLLRSLAVVSCQQIQGLGSALHKRIMAHAVLRGAKTAYILTTTAERFFAKRGYERIDRCAVPAAVAQSAELTTLCPVTATCMCRRLDTEALHFSSDVLCLRPDVPGASMWAVALERAMLTYFEIEPHSRFAEHSHVSEQITMVLSGELFFEIAKGDHVAVKAGEVIAIPANVSHAAWTDEQSAKAVDAWSPVRADFLR